MSEKYTPEQVRDFWSRQADAHGQSSNASWSDRPVIELEIAEIVKHLRDGDRVLDVGCANGYSTVQFAAAREIAIRGVDYIPGMIENARARLTALPKSARRRIDFAVADILQLDEADGAYDAVVVVRVLINVGTRENQARGIAECARVLRCGGTLLLSEATLQGWRRLNAFRAEWRLPEIPMPPFNEYVDEDHVAAVAAESLDLVAIVNFASTYYVGSRVLKPLLSAALGGFVDVTDPNAEWNRFWASLPPSGDYGTQKLFVFRKR
jgi:SAM-dependent methyltransferase